MQKNNETAARPIAGALLFDMDGTLWNAVSSYATIWNTTFREFGVRRAPVSEQELIALMGQRLEDFIGRLVPPGEDKPGLLDAVFANEKRMMPQLGGVLYDGVRDTLERLSKRLPLFLVSNCGADGLNNFLNYTGLRAFFKDSLTAGETGRPKSDNIRALVTRYKLRDSYYVGDTVTDAVSAREAGTGMIWCRYGFGSVTADMYDYVIDSFPAILDVPPVAAALSAGQ